MTTATRTVLFTDLANYTAQVSRADREGLRKILEKHERLVHPIVKEHAGAVVKNIGDSFMCTFPAATDALRAAIGILDATVRSEKSMIRIALTTGDVEEIDGDAFGETVNLAARIIDKTPAGEIWFSLGTRVCMNDAEIPWENVARLILKGIATEQECFRVVPNHRCWLPHPISKAIGDGKLFRIKHGEGLSADIPSDAVLLFENFVLGSDELESALSSIPALEPSALFISAYTPAPSDRETWRKTGRGLVVGTSDAIDRAILEEAERDEAGDANVDLSETISIAQLKRADCELYIGGLALPTVPFSNIVASYSYDLLADGSWVSQADTAVLRVEVRPGRVSVRALVNGVTAAGRLLECGESVRMSARGTIASPAGQVTFVPLEHGYSGVLLSEAAMSLALKTGQTAEIGRQPNPPGLPFPARNGTNNIQWCPGERASRARAGRFTLDRVLAGRRQASIELRDDSIKLTPLHDECPTFVLREKKLHRTNAPTRLTSGDMVVLAPPLWVWKTLR